MSNAESVTALDSEGEGSTRGVNALALAGPVPNPLGYRYSADYTEPSFPPKNNVSTAEYSEWRVRKVEKSRRMHELSKFLCSLRSRAEKMPRTGARA